MAFGFPAYHRHRERFGLAPGAILDAVREALSGLQWHVVSDADRRIITHVKTNLWSWGEEVELVVDGDELSIVSKCRMPTQCLDWGKNKRNVGELLARLPQPLVEGLDAAHGASGSPVGAGAVVPRSRSSV